MTIPQIRRELQKQSNSLFFTKAERALLAILDDSSYAESPYAIINATYTQARIHAEKRVRDIIRNVWE